MRLLQTQLLTSMNTHIAYFKQTVSRHVSSERPVNTSPNWHPCCRQWAWKQAFARTWPLESTWFEAQMRGKHHFHSEATWISKVPKKICKRTDLHLYPGCKKCIQVEDSRSMFEVKLSRGKKGNAAERSPWWLQPVRTWNEMCLAVCLWLWGLSFLHY